jgi:hypothetical protein
MLKDLGRKLLKWGLVILTAGYLAGCGTSGDGGAGGPLGPSSPTSLTAVDTPNDRGGSITLKWTPSSSADVQVHRVYRKAVNDSHYSLLVDITSARANTYKDTGIGLINGTICYYVVKAFNGTSESAGSNEASATPVDNMTISSVEVTPNSSAISVGSTGQQFTAVAKDAGGIPTSNQTFGWSLVNDDGTKGFVNSQSGFYTPPVSLPDSNVVVVQATSTSNSSMKGSATVTLLTGGLLSFGSNIRVAPHTTGDDSSALSRQNVSVLDQSVVTTWADNPDGSSGDYDTYFERSLDRGQSIYCQTRLQLAQDQLSPSLALDSQGDVYAVAFNNSNGGNYGILFVKGHPSSSNCIDFDQQSVIYFSNTETYFSPNITIGPDGNVYVAWGWSSGSASGVYYARGVKNSQTGQVDFGQKSPAVQDPTGASVYEDPKILIATDGKIYIALSQTLTGESHTILAKSMDGGTTFQEIRVGDNQAYALYPAMAVDSAGVIYVAWTDFRSATPKIFLAKSTNEGQDFSISNVTESIAGEQWLPAISVDQGGGLYLVWENVDLTGDQDIFFAKSIDGGLNFSIPVRTNDDSANQYAPSLTLDSAGRAFVLWFDERNACPVSCPFALYLAVGQ